MEIYKNEKTLAFEKMYQKYYGRILAYFNQHTGKKEDAEDLANDVFLYAFKNLDAYDEKKASFATWIYTIAKSRFKNYLRSKKIHDDIEDYPDIIGDSGEYEDYVILQEKRELLYQVLQQLTDQQRKIIILKYFQQMKNTEIAEILNKNPNNIGVQASKALAALKKKLHELGCDTL